MNKVDLLRRSVCCGVAMVVLGLPALPRAQGGSAIPQSNITYILPQWTAFTTTTERRLPASWRSCGRGYREGPRVKVGFTTYINISMDDPLVDPSNPAAIQATALAGTFQQMDAAINRARQYDVPICLSFLTTIREAADAVEVAGEAATAATCSGTRTTCLASNWSTYSRYARKQRRLQEAYMREVGRRLAKRMAQYPDDSGRGER